MGDCCGLAKRKEWPHGRNVVRRLRVRMNETKEWKEVAVLGSRVRRRAESSACNQRPDGRRWSPAAPLLSAPQPKKRIAQPVGGACYCVLLQAETPQVSSRDALNGNELLANETVRPHPMPGVPGNCDLQVSGKDWRIGRSPRPQVLTRIRLEGDTKMISGIKNRDGKEMKCCGHNARIHVYPGLPNSRLLTVWIQIVSETAESSYTGMKSTKTMHAPF
ncbi:hypothetical protein F5144DRAFT_561888 [Chaetomium tenue]|uniref:Uncharacterized protein n=1 Tax=Chaetomium tenue TaxID=1854479 RepID=A0ACB7PFY8_9PEZI|nr:hypothetical protein F5144DRAFT_561888 [Chaetomium globosum]